MLMQDSERNEAYRRGIEAVVEEDDLVVDIGTGSGLLALMAAKAGAQVSGEDAKR
jgi:predicted RNA methylase